MFFFLKHLHPFYVQGEVDCFRSVRGRFFFLQIHRVTCLMPLYQAADWFKSNRLIVNAEKSSVMFIASSHIIDNLNNPAPLMINNKSLERVTNAKFLGVMIDETLSWNVHIQYLCSKINYKIVLIHRLRQYLPQSALNTLYLTLIQPHFDYCLTV